MHVRLALTVPGILALALAAVAATAAAQDPIRLPTNELPGYTIEGFVDFLIVHNPNPPIPPLVVYVPAEDVIVVVSPSGVLNPCQTDEAVLAALGLSGNPAPCSHPVRAEVASPCDGVLEQVASAPLAGSEASARAQAALDAIDSTMEGPVRSTLESLEVERFNWGRASNRAVNDCSGHMQPAETGAAARESRVILNVAPVPRTCPNPNNELLCPVPRPTPLGDGVDEGTRGIEAPFATQACVYRGIRADCGNITVQRTRLHANPLDPYNDLVDATGKALDDGEVTRDGEVEQSPQLESAAIRPVEQGETVRVPLGELPRCVTPGWPAGPHGDLPGPPIAILRISPNGGRLYAGLEKVANQALTTAAPHVDTFNRYSQALPSTWDETNADLLAAYEAYYPYSRHPGGQPTDARCDA